MERTIGGGLTRREFLKGAGAVVAGGVVVGVVGSQLSFKELPAVEIKKAMGYVSVNPEHCAQCSICEAACSLFHEGVVNAETSRIHVINYAPDRAFEARPVVCWQCDGPECVYICEQYATGAFYADETTGARVIDQDLCDGCKLCMGACPLFPHTPIRYVAETNTCINCDLCGGDPYCVKFCPPSAEVAGRPYIHPEKDKVLKFVKSMYEGADEGVGRLANDKAGYWWGFSDGRKGFRSPS